MGIRTRYCFHNVICEFNDYGTAAFFGFWKWNLDPFETLFSFNTTGSVVVENRLSEDLPGPWTHVTTLGTKWFQMHVSADSEGNTLWQYLWVARNQLFTSHWMSKQYDAIQLLSDNSNTSGYLPFVCLGHMFPSVMLKHDAITFHGVLMEHEGRGIILSAPSGTGKTTHARLWRDHRRALILNGDRATCCLEDGRWIGFSLPWCGSSGECINRDVPLTAYVVLEQALENSVERLYGMDAFGAVYQNLVYPNWDRELTEKALDFINDFLENIPVFRLRCRPDVEAVETLEAALREL